jgi:hypothetical protein
MFITAIVIKVKKWKQVKRPSIGELDKQTKYGTSSQWNIIQP